MKQTYTPRGKKDANQEGDLQEPRRDLIDPELFGNEAGDDEDMAVLDSYFLEKPEFARFGSPSTKLAFVRSRKGVGKSALLRRTQYQREKSDAGELIIYVKAADLSALQDIDHSSPDQLIYGWQQRICTQINRELGACLRVGFTDDAMLLIESAELAGFRNRNLVSALFDRLKIKGLGPEIDRSRLQVADAQALTERVLEKRGVTVWVFIDDIDATFLNTENERLKVSTFFSACRNLTSSVSGLCIRASVRTDVWSVVTQYDEALDKCEQYMLDLVWSTTETGRIIEKKLLSYFRRFYPEEHRYKNLRLPEHGEEVRKIVFKEPFRWGERSVESFRPIHILSAGRPRWAAQLCKFAGKDAHSKNFALIGIGHINSILKKYGVFRISDLYKEHRHQCPNLQLIIESFSGGQFRFTTEQLLGHIFERIVKRHGIPKIDGVSQERGVLSVAHFLYRTGFIAARDENDPTGLGFIRFEDRPDLLTVDENLDDGLAWEIHPSYREVLRLKRA